MTKDPVAIVTGAASGIGAATVSRLEQEGWCVVAADLRSQGRIEACDVRSDQQVIDLVGRAVSRHSRVDGLVNAAGVGFPEPFLETDDESWNRVLDINLLGTVRLCRAALPHIRESEHPGAGIVNFTSQAAKTGGLLIGAHYCAAKAAVMCLTFSLANEFGPAGVRVNAVAPGIVDTPFLDQVPGIRERGEATPLRRVGQPVEVASVISFLLSAESSYVCGEVIDVNGGLYVD